MRPLSTRQFKRLIADTRAAIEREDVPRARELLLPCPASHERVAAQMQFDYSSPPGRKEPLDLPSRSMNARVSQPSRLSMLTHNDRKTSNTSDDAPRHL